MNREDKVLHQQCAKLIDRMIKEGHTKKNLTEEEKQEAVRKLVAAIKRARNAMRSEFDA